MSCRFVRVWDRSLEGGTENVASVRRFKELLAKANNPEQNARVNRVAERLPGMAGLLARLESCVPALRRYAAALSSDQREADDLVQACLTSALDRLHGLDQGTELRVRLFAIIYRQLTVGSRWRRWRHQPRTPAEQPHPGSIDVIQALASLPLEQRCAMFLVSVEDLSYPAVAEVLGVPTGTVQSLLKAGRNQLHELMGDAAPCSPRRTT